VTYCCFFIIFSQKGKENMNKIIFRIVSPVLCSVVAISAQQAEQSLPQPQPQQEQQIQQPLLPTEVQQQVQQPLPLPAEVQQQVQQALPPPPVQQQVQLPLSPITPVQQQMQNCPQPLAQTKMGLYARFNLNSVSYGFNNKKNEKIDMGIGFGGGIIRRTPITNHLDVNPEIGFFHRNLYSEKVKAKGNSIYDGHEIDEYWYDEKEFVLNVIPVLIQFTPFEVPFYVAVGFQLDFPVLAKISVTTKYKDDSIDYDESTQNYRDRAGYDLGVVWGLGYNVTEHFSFNFRSVVGLGSVTGKSSDARTPTQYGLGVTFF
jgi:hypothetical protein